MEPKNLKGQRFGRLIPTKMSKIRQNHRSYIVWRCNCDCGNVCEIKSCYLLSGDTVSCGCFHREVIRRPKIWIHGHASGSRPTRLYTIWQQMNQRCENSNLAGFKNYGGRGIRVCEEWRDSFVRFAEWATKSGYDSKLQIDRINNDLGYCPENCRWVTCLVNQNNKRTNCVLEFPYGRATVADAARHYRMRYGLLLQRIRFAKLTPSEAVILPLRYRR